MKIIKQSIQRIKYIKLVKMRRKI